MKTKFLVGLLIAGLVFISGCAQKEGPPAEGEEKVPGEEKKWVAPEVDSSISWESMNGPPGAGNIGQLIQNPYRHNELYAATRYALYKSEDKGESWQKISGSKRASIAVFEDKLFTCRDGVHYYDNEGNPVKILDVWCGEIIVSDNKVFVTSDSGKLVGSKIMYADLASWEASKNLVWKDISISESELRGLVLPSDGKGMRVQGIVALGNRILAGVNVIKGGRGELSKSYLYVSEDLGETWSMVELGTPDGVIISKIVQNPDNPRHIVLSFKYNIVHEYFSPLSELLKESYDGGKTWGKITGLTLKSNGMKTLTSNGIEDVVILGSAYYLLSPYGGPPILKLEGSSYEQISAPMIGEFTDMSFGLDTLLFDFDDPNIVYGKTGSIWALGMVKSVDGMKTWKKMDGDIIASSPTIVLTHPTNSNVVFTSGNVIQESYATRNGGRTWEPFSPVAAGDDVRIDPHNLEHILLVDELTNIYESYDSGRTFTRIAEDFSSAKIFDFEIAEDGSIYASNIGVGISKSSGSRDWQYLTYSPDYTYDIEFDPEDSSIIYATYSPKIFENHSSVWKYSKNQQSWSEIFRVEDSRGVTSLAIDELNPDNMYAGVVGKEGKIYYSSDRGSNWQKLNIDLTFTTIHAMEVDPNDEEVVYAAPWGAGLFKTSDGGLSWSKISGDDEEEPFSVAAIKVNPANSNQLYAEDRSEATLWASNDKGSTWFVKWRPGGEYFRLNTFTFDPVNPNIYYVSAWKHGRGQPIGELFRHNEDESWDDITNELPRAVLDVEADPSNPDTLYASLHVYGMYKSTNGGESWQEITSFPRVGAFDLAFNSGAIYAATNCGDMPEALLEGLLQVEGDCGVYKSTDNGETWVNLAPENLKTTAIKQIAFSEGKIYIATNDDAYVSSDESNWQSLNVPFKETAAIAVTENKIYVGTHGAGVYQSNVNSIDWNTKGPFAEIYNIQIVTDPSDSDTLYASSYPGGVFKSTDQGISWNEKNFALPSFRVEDPKIQGYYSLEIDSSNPDTLYLGIFGKGIFKSFDGAATWMAMYGKQGQNSEIMNKGITKIRADSLNPNKIYLATNEGVYFSDDGTENWVEMNSGLETLDIRSLKIISSEYAPSEYDFEDGTADGWKSDGGWSVIQENGNYILQGTGHNWIITGSESWADYTFESKVKLIEGSVHVNYRTSGVERYAVGVTDGSLYLMRTALEGKESVHTQLKSSSMQFAKNKWYDIKIAGKGNNIKVYVDGVLKIDYTDNKPLLNGGIAFESLPDSEIQVDDVVVTIDSTSAEIYAGTAGYGIYEFNPTSKEWHNLGGTLGSGFWSPWERRMYQFSSILFDPDVPGKVYYGHFPSGFFISEDNGHTWKDSSLGLGNDGMFSLSMHPHNHDILFAGTYNGVVKSVDRGRTWEMISNGIPPEQWPYTVAIDDENPNIMYTSTKNGQNKGFCERNDFCGVVMKTTNGGESWFKIMNGLDEYRSEFYILLIYPPNHNILFLSSSNGVYISRDAGNSWKSINTGLPSTDNQVRDNVADNLALTPDNKYLIFGLMDSGAWKADLSNADLGS